MANTTCIRAITAVAPFMNEESINMSYANSHTPQPQSIEETPVPYWRMSHYIVPCDVLVNASTSALHRDDTDTISYEIMSGVYVTYIREGVQL